MLRSEKLMGLERKKHKSCGVEYSALRDTYTAEVRTKDQVYCDMQGWYKQTAITKGNPPNRKTRKEGMKCGASVEMEKRSV